VSDNGTGTEAVANGPAGGSTSISGAWYSAGWIGEAGSSKGISDFGSGVGDRSTFCGSPGGAALGPVGPAPNSVGTTFVASTADGASAAAGLAGTAGSSSFTRPSAASSTIAADSLAKGSGFCSAPSVDRSGEATGLSGFLATAMSSLSGNPSDEPVKADQAAPTTRTIDSPIATSPKASRDESFRRGAAGAGSEAGAAGSRERVIGGELARRCDDASVNVDSAAISPVVGVS
jgi:hypothetical protein